MTRTQKVTSLIKNLDLEASAETWRMAVIVLGEGMCFVGGVVSPGMGFNVSKAEARPVSLSSLENMI